MGWVQIHKREIRIIFNLTAKWTELRHVLITAVGQILNVLPFELAGLLQFW
jgi:hypothetical protein